MYVAGKCARTMFFVTYISPVACIANKFAAFLSQYTDDTQLHAALSKKAVNDAVTNIQNSLFDDHMWFRQKSKWTHHQPRKI